MTHYALTFLTDDLSD